MEPKRDMRLKKEMFCSICGGRNEKWSDNFYGHNAEPVNDGRCCGDCNEWKVIPPALRSSCKGPRIRRATRGI